MTRPADLIADLAERLANAGVESPGADARWLVAHAAGKEPAALLAMWEVDADVVQVANALIDRRVAGEPVQHITGCAYFRYERLSVGPGVFIPRPETELVAGAAIEALALRPAKQRVFVELCAGSGAITRSVMRELGGVQAYANEISPVATAYLRRNLEGLGVDIELGDFRDAFFTLSAQVDVIAVNPPYIPEPLRKSLPREVTCDPPEALFAGPDGLTFMEDLARTALRLLRSGGVLVLEHDESHQRQVVAIFEDAGFVGITPQADYTGRARFVVARK